LGKLEGQLAGPDAQTQNLLAGFAHTPDEHVAPVSPPEHPCANVVKAAAGVGVDVDCAHALPDAGTGKPITEAGLASVTHEPSTVTTVYTDGPPWHDVEPPYA
jgi:hypothetical protein